MIHKLKELALQAAIFLIFCVGAVLAPLEAKGQTVSFGYQGRGVSIQTELRDPLSYSAVGVGVAYGASVRSNSNVQYYPQPQTYGGYQAYQQKMADSERQHRCRECRPPTPWDHQRAPWMR